MPLGTAGRFDFRGFDGALLQNSLSNVPRNHAEKILKTFSAFSVNEQMNVVSTDGFLINTDMESLTGSFEHFFNQGAVPYERASFVRIV